MKRSLPPPSRQNTIRHSGFTLIEILIVAGIITVLAALSMPAFKNVLSGSKLTKCSSNLRQWGMGFQMYMNDHDGYFPQQAEVAGNADTHWQELIAPYVVGDRKNWSQRNVMRTDFACPGEKVAGGIVYGGNIYLRPTQYNKAPQKLISLNHKFSDFALLADNYTGEFWTTVPKANPTSGGVSYSRHKVGSKDVANFLFADFHVEPLSYQQTLDRPVICMP